MKDVKEKCLKEKSFIHYSVLLQICVTHSLGGEPAFRAAKKRNSTLKIKIEECR